MKIVANKGWEITQGDEAYPHSLLDLEKPPEVLYGKGDPNVLSEPCLSIIGARRATPYGLALANMASRVACECGITVVSGGAMGCDFAAGSTALASGGKSVVVSGCGADLVYPSSSRSLFEGVVIHGGAVISLEPWGSPPRRWAFPKRNRIIAALSHVLIVTEASLQSGTMSTAEAASELDRIIYAVPGSIFSPTSCGTNHLIAEGAQIICDERSLELSISLDYGVSRFVVEKRTSAVGPVMSAIQASPMRPDELACRLGDSVLTTLKTLTDYETKGMVKRLPDGTYTASESFLLEQNGFLPKKDRRKK